MWMETEANTAREAAHSLIDTSMNVCLPRYKLLQMQFQGNPSDALGLPVPVQSQCDNYYNCAG